MLRHRGGMAQPVEVVDIVAAKAGADELLEEVRLLVRALGGAEPRERAPAGPGTNALEALGGAIERLFPAGLAEMRVGMGRGEPYDRQGTRLNARHSVASDALVFVQIDTAYRMSCDSAVGCKA